MSSRHIISAPEVVILAALSGFGSRETRREHNRLISTFWSALVIERRERQLAAIGSRGWVNVLAEFRDADGEIEVDVSCPAEQVHQPKRQRALKFLKRR